MRLPVDVVDLLCVEPDWVELLVEAAAFGCHGSRAAAAAIERTGFRIERCRRLRFSPEGGRIVAEVAGHQVREQEVRTRRRLAITAVATIALAACTWGGGGDGAAPDGPPPGSIDRLLVLGDDGNVFTVRRDGEARVAVTSNAAADLVYLQPTWSPTSERIAFARIDAREGASRPALVTALADGSGRTEATTSTPPFYIHWSPGGDRLVFLAAGPAGLDLRLVDVGAGGTEAETIATGSPFYLSWAADGRELLTHVGAGTAGSLGRLQTDGEAQPLPGRPGRFQAPQWSQAGDQLVYALGEGSSQRLVVADSDGAVQREVARLEGLVVFTLDPAGERLAFTVHDAGDAPDGGVEAAGSVAAQPAEDTPPGRLVVAHLETGVQQAVADGPVVLMQWSPDGGALLFATLEVVGSAAALRWQVWDSERVLRFDRTRPTTTFAQQYLPFFDQYSRSLTLWSPNGDAFTYAGRDDDGVTGIWVQPTEEDRPPERVTGGQFASWSPR